ncbi:MAG: DUF2288 domain-containing protein [Pseudomonadota bacterium]
MVDPDVLKARLNLDTGRLDWPMLARHFARGAVIVVAAGTDLVEVAAALVEDEHGRLADWLAEGRVAKATDADAEGWQARTAVFWAVVVAPWVLVQEIQPAGMP